MKPHFLLARSDIAFPKRVFFTEIQLHSMSSTSSRAADFRIRKKTHGFCRQQLPNQHSDGIGITVLLLCDMCRRLIWRARHQTVAHTPALHVHYLVSRPRLG
ncbi:hypothetical protein J6590_061242 [Homalodisca vitripennis]|nr:hypothetical protein J6590_061242 [Homalodisca vitripennis]